MSCSRSSQQLKAPQWEAGSGSCLPSCYLTSYHYPPSSWCYAGCFQVLKLSTLLLLRAFTYILPIAWKTLAQVSPLHWVTPFSLP